MWLNSFKKFDFILGKQDLKRCFTLSHPPPNFNRASEKMGKKRF
jgi:hypothetical protein